MSLFNVRLFGTGKKSPPKAHMTLRHLCALLPHSCIIPLFYNNMIEVLHVNKKSLIFATEFNL